ELRARLGAGEARISVTDKRDGDHKRRAAGDHGGTDRTESPVSQEVAVAVTPPSNEEIAAIAERYGLGLGPRAVGEYRELFAAALISYDEVERRSAARVPERPAREWQRPGEADNELGAWYVTTDIKGTAGGPLAGRRVAVKDNIAVAGVPMMNGSATVE